MFLVTSVDIVELPSLEIELSLELSLLCTCGEKIIIKRTLCFNDRGGHYGTVVVRDRTVHGVLTVKLMTTRGSTADTR